MSEERKKQKVGEQAKLLFDMGSICQYSFSMPGFEKGCHRWGRKHHKVPMKSPYIDWRRDGELKIPKDKNAFRLETFASDVFEYLGAVSGIMVDKTEEYAPIKNAEGDESIATALAGMSQLHQKWILSVFSKSMSFRGFENMLANEAFEGRIEVSPLVSYEGEGLVGQFQSEVVIKMPLIICSKQELEHTNVSVTSKQLLRQTSVHYITIGGDMHDREEKFVKSVLSRDERLYKNADTQVDDPKADNADDSLRLPPTPADDATVQEEERRRREEELRKAQDNWSTSEAWITAMANLKRLNLLDQIDAEREEKARELARQKEEEEGGPRSARSNRSSPRQTQSPRSPRGTQMSPRQTMMSPRGGGSMSPRQTMMSPRGGPSSPRGTRMTQGDMSPRSPRGTRQTMAQDSRQDRKSRRTEAQVEEPNSPGASPGRGTRMTTADSPGASPGRGRMTTSGESPRSPAKGKGKGSREMRKTMAGKGAGDDEPSSPSRNSKGDSSPGKKGSPGRASSGGKASPGGKGGGSPGRASSATSSGLKRDSK